MREIGSEICNIAGPRRGWEASHTHDLALRYARISEHELTPRTPLPSPSLSHPAAQHRQPQAVPGGPHRQARDGQAEVGHGVQGLPRLHRCVHEPSGMRWWGVVNLRPSVGPREGLSGWAARNRSLGASVNGISREREHVAARKSLWWRSSP